MVLPWYYHALATLTTTTPTPFRVGVVGVVEEVLRQDCGVAFEAMYLLARCHNDGEA